MTCPENLRSMTYQGERWIPLQTLLDIADGLIDREPQTASALAIVARVLEDTTWTEEPA